MREYVEPMHGWGDADFQRRFHAGWFEPDRLSIIEDDDGTAIGVLDVSDEGDHLYLGRIEVLPEAQGHGIGTAVVRDVLRRGRTVRLHVFTNNVRARRFYERLGFRVDRYSQREGGYRCIIPVRPSRSRSQFGPRNKCPDATRRDLARGGRLGISQRTHVAPPARSRPPHMSTIRRYRSLPMWSLPGLQLP